MENDNNREAFQDDDLRNEKRYGAGENENYSQSPENEDENGAGGKLGKADEREEASDGDWDSMRDQTTAEDSSYGDSDPDPGGAGSTGSEATNSGTPGSL